MFRKKSKEPDLPPSWLIVGLGNPGPEYRGTRHNVGFEVIDLLAQRHRIKVDRGRNRALTGAGMISSEGILLVKPLTFMNNSGQAVAPVAKAMGIPPSNILVLADDLDLPVGKIKLPESGSAGGHNGHKSIIASLGTMDYPRIKIGIGADKESTIDHVLGTFKPLERDEIDTAIEVAADTVEAYIAGGREQALRVLEKYHQK
ncbi:MAG: aminoacyl-tRNA hydrolase [Fimbriimonadaceae bacterium]